MAKFVLHYVILHYKMYLAILCFIIWLRMLLHGTLPPQINPIVYHVVLLYGKTYMHTYLYICVLCNSRQDETMNLGRSQTRQADAQRIRLHGCPRRCSLTSKGSCSAKSVESKAAVPSRG